MTDREKMMIDAYIPSPRDPALDVCEYYAQDANGRIHKVYIRDIFPENDCTLYGVRYSGSDRAFTGGYGEYGKMHMYELYDNKDDCRDRTHMFFDGWEYLRRLQNDDGIRVWIC